MAASHMLFLVLTFLFPHASHSVQFTTQPQLPPPLLRPQVVGTENGNMLLNPSDAAALLAIRTSLRDLPGSTFFSTWDTAAADPCSTYAGVTCAPDQDSSSPSYLRVTSLALGSGLADSPGLAGSFPAAVSSLSALTQLILFAGRVSGALPFNIGDTLPSLQFLSVTNNLISGPVPQSLANLRLLHTLDLGRIRLSGPVPQGLFTLPALRVLILASNGYLSGELPGDVTSPLLHLDIRGNTFTGTLPPALPKTLRYLSASSNSLTGTLVPVSDLPDLAFLDLAMNSFSGPIPPSLLSPSIPLLLLQRNNLSGMLPAYAAPSALVASDSIEDSGWTVDLSHNRLAGQVTLALAGAESVYLNNNRFIGPVPSEYARAAYDGTLRSFHAQHNFLTGFDHPLPTGGGGVPPLPDGVSVCLAFNCMVPPPVRPAACPTGAGEAIARPTWQCPVFYNATARDDADAAAPVTGGTGG